MTCGKADFFHGGFPDTPMNGGEIVLQGLCDAMSKQLSGSRHFRADRGQDRPSIGARLR